MSSVALKMLFGDPAKYLGLVFGVMFGSLLMVQQTSIFCGLMNRTTSQILDVHEADLWVMHPQVQYVDEVQPLSDNEVYRVRGVQGVEWAVRLYKGNAVARSTDGLLQQLILMGIDDATLIGAPRKMVMGSVEDLKKPDAMIIDKAGYEFIWPGEPLQLGKVLELNERRAVIVGICDASAPFATAPVVYTRYSVAMNLIARQRNQLSYVLVKGQPGQDLKQLEQRIEAQTGLEAMWWSDFAWKTIGYYMRRTGIPVNFGITVLLGFIVGAAIAGQTLYIFTIENLKQFGALKAIGVSNRKIIGMVLLQAGVVGIIGYSLGMGVSAVFFETTSRTVVNLRGFYMPWEVMLATGAAVLLILVVASFASVRKVLVVDPASVFR